MIDTVLQACHTFHEESTLVKRFVTRDLRLPDLKPETHFSQSDAGPTRMRIEAFLEMIAEHG